MDSTSCKTSCALLLMMMMLSATEGASILRECHNFTNGSHPDHKHIVPLQLDPRYLTPVTSIVPLSNDSISPWTWVENRDRSLYNPVSEARCLLKGCLNSDGIEDLSLQSKPIFREVLNLRRVRSSSGPCYHYRLEQRLVAVGCTCVRIEFIEQQ